MSRNVRQRKKLVQTAIILGLLSGIGTINADAVVPSEGITISQQKEIVVKGTVKDKTGETIPGANIVVKGTNSGTTTDYDGNFSLEVPANAILEVSFIGYKTADVPVNNQNNIDVVLSSTVEELDEVVVTALGIKREKKSLGYAMQEIKTESMAEIRSESVANMLQGKVAGVQISQSGTGMGGSTRIILRGTTSLSGNNQPLWVVDGMPINDGQAGSANQWGGIDYEGAAAQINPDDIESISVLKGANAAALYGSRAQNGAIIVTTKKGKSGKLQIEYNGNINFSQAYDSYDYQNTYSQGSNGKFVVGEKGSWGQLMDGKTSVNSWRGVNSNSYYNDSRYESTYLLTPQDDYISDFYRTGVNYTNTLTASGGSDNVTTRFSFSDQRNEGITPNHSLNKQYFDLHSELKSKYLDLSVKVNYMRQKGEGRPAQGEYGVMKSFVTMPRGIRLSDLEDPIGTNGNTVNWSGTSAEYRNPYRDVYGANLNNDQTNRIIGSVQAVGKITDWLKLTGRVGIDWYNNKRVTQNVYAQNITDTNYNLVLANTEEFNADLMLNFNKRFGDFDITANFGTAMTANKYQAMSGSSGYFNVPGFPTIGNGNNQTVTEDFSKKRINSVLGNASFGWKSMVYLDVTARNDWSSTLPIDNRSYFYPSVSLSGIISEMVKMPEQISYLKLRTSYAQVGNDTDPYKLRSIFYFETFGGGNVNTTPGDPNNGNLSILPLTTLKPEDTRSFEVGLEYRMFNNRLGLDVTYYNANTLNQILNVTTPGSSGYERQLINAGKMRSYGTEVSLTGTPIATKDWNWDVTLNWGFNRTKCVELDEQLKTFIIGETRIGKVVVNEGGKYGDIVALKHYERDDNGNILIGDNGMPIITSGEKKIGNMTPDWTGSFATTLRWKNLSLSALLDIRVGGDIISMTDAYATSHGTAEKTLEGRENGIVIPGINKETGTVNNTSVKPEDYWQVVGGTGVAEEYMYDASYIKFRELSLGYTLPQTWLRNLPISNVKLSFVGRDLFYIFKNAPVNPESALGRQDYAQAFEYMALPSTRSFGFTLNVKF